MHACRSTLEDPTVRRPIGATLRALWPLFALLLGVQTLLGVFAARAWLARHHTLQANGQWTATKTELERGLMGAFAFVTERQTLAGGWLHLDAWHGFHELMLRREVHELREIEAEFDLAPNGHFSLIFDRLPLGAGAAIRLSAWKERPPALLELDAEGRFERVTRLGPAFAKGHHKATIAIETDRVRLTVDGEVVGEAPFAPRGGGRVGLRGGSKRVDVDEVTFVAASGERVHETFDSPSGSTWIVVGAVALSIALNALLFAFLRRQRELRPDSDPDKLIAFRLFAWNLTLAVSLGALAFYVEKTGGWYPRLDETLERAEAYFGKGATANVLAEIEQRHGRGPRADRFRIAFVGSSQTWGAGSSRDDGIWIRRVERALAQRFPGAPTIECINGGVSSMKAAELEPIVRERLLPLGARILVIDLGSNDKASGETFVPAIRAMVAAARAAGAEPLLVAEPNALEEGSKGLGYRHAELTLIGSEEGVAVVPMHEHLLRLDASGWLWWDRVHLTDYGQRLFAERMVEELAPMVERLRGVPARAAQP